MGAYPVTLSRQIQDDLRGDPAWAAELTPIMAQIALAAKTIARDLREAGLLDVLGLTGTTNVQGEAVQKLDQKANETFVRVFQGYGTLVRTLISEEMEKPLDLPASAEGSRDKYALFFDPLDGSSNVDVNATVGSIFSLHRVPPHPAPDARDLLKPGREQVAVGYALYGPSTVLVYTCGRGVHQFTLDHSLGEFVLSVSHMKMPPRGKVYSANEGNYPRWTAGTKRFVDYLREKDPETGRPYSTRYSGCLVADVHRLLAVGGVYLYPGEADKPGGKLRLMYEAAPLGLLVEQAGGKATTGTQTITAIRPEAVHQRVPLIIGSHQDVTVAEEFIQGRRQ
jgi:fructose-1,6-bisphosphatase I